MGTVVDIKKGWRIRKAKLAEEALAVARRQCERLWPLMSPEQRTEATDRLRATERAVERVKKEIG